MKIERKICLMVLRVSSLSNSKPFLINLSHFGTSCLNKEKTSEFIILIAEESQNSKLIDRKSLSKSLYSS